MRTRFPDPADAWTEEDAGAVLDEWRRSGESMATFARRRGMTPARLYWWKKRLAATPSATPTLSLVSASIISTDASITIRLPGDVIEVANASPSWLAAVIATLARPLP